LTPPQSTWTAAGQPGGSWKGAHEVAAAAAADSVLTFFSPSYTRSALAFSSLENSAERQGHVNHVMVTLMTP
jgi:hypothetical protein